MSYLEDSKQAHHITTQKTYGQYSGLEEISPQDTESNLISLFSDRNTAAMYGESPHIGPTLSTYQTAQTSFYATLVGTQVYTDATKVMPDLNALTTVQGIINDYNNVLRQGLLTSQLFASYPTYAPVDDPFARDA